MKLSIIAVGTKMPQWVEEAYADYAKRMPPDFSLTLKEVKPEPRTMGKSTAQIMDAEAKRIESHLSAGALCFALDERGKSYTSVQLADTLNQWRERSSEVLFIIGGADGLAPSLKNNCDGLIRLSDLTLPHGMVRVMLAEQLYRAWSIVNHHPYHRS